MRQLFTSIGIATAHPAAFFVVGLYALTWINFGHFDWHGGATLATWMMTLFIQRAEHRDTQAIHAKLDELLKAHGDARSGLAKIDEREPEEIEKYRDNERDIRR